MAAAAAQETLPSVEIEVLHTLFLKNGAIVDGLVLLGELMRWCGSDSGNEQDGR